MPEDIEEALAELLVKLGYKDVDHNHGTVWYTDKYGLTWSLCPQICE